MAALNLPGTSIRVNVNLLSLLLIDDMIFPNQLPLELSLSQS